MNNEFKYELLPQTAGEGPLFSALRRINAATGDVVDIIPVEADESEHLQVLLESKNRADRQLNEYIESLF